MTTEPLRSPSPYFGGKHKAAPTVWEAFGQVDNYVEPFAGSAAMLLAAPEGRRIETINDFDGFVANFWRAVSHDPDAVAHAADWPVNEVDLFARHSWLVRQRATLTEQLHADPAYYDARIAGWWVWGACNWIGSGWCSGTGPWVHDGERIVRKEAARGAQGHLGASRASTASYRTWATRGRASTASCRTWATRGRGDRAGRASTASCRTWATRGRAANTRARSSSAIGCASCTSACAMCA